MNIGDVLQTLHAMAEEGVVETYALGGAVAATYYLEPISTLDVDVFVRLKAKPDQAIIDPGPIFAFLAQRGHYLEGEYAVIGGWPVQFLAPPGALGDEALDRAEVVDADGTPVRLLPAEYLAAIALEVGRPKDKERIRMFLDSSEFDRDRFEDIVGRHGLESQWAKFKNETKIDL